MFFPSWFNVEPWFGCMLLLLRSDMYADSPGRRGQPRGSVLWGSPRKTVNHSIAERDLMGEARRNKGKLRLAEFLYGVGRVSVVLAVLELPTSAVAAPWRTKFLQRLAAPFRSNPLLQKRSAPCNLGFANCILPGASQSTNGFSEPLRDRDIEDPSRVVALHLRALHGGPFTHHWVEVETSQGKVTLGFGPATLPFIDAGQISLQDNHGNVERISGMHPLPILGLPPLNYRYAKAPGAGHPIGKPISLTIAHADVLVEKIRHPRFIVPYVPIFHDCRTFACVVQARAEGRSSLPCYLLFKGYW